MFGCCSLWWFALVGGLVCFVCCCLFFCFGLLVFSWGFSAFFGSAYALDFWRIVFCFGRWFGSDDALFLVFAMIFKALKCFFGRFWF